jgi:hypothetical protein
MSERDGWAHLYMFDGATGGEESDHQGQLDGPRVVRRGRGRQQITFMAGGINPKQDPYFVQYYRVNFDGTGLTALTDATDITPQCFHRTTSTSSTPGHAWISRRYQSSSARAMRRSCSNWNAVT